MQNQNPSPIDFEKIGAESAKLVEKFFNDQSENMASSQHLVDAFQNFSKNWASNPEQIVKMQVDLYQNYLNLWSSMAEKMMGKEDVAPTVSPEKTDRRFQADEWNTNVVFDFIKQSYLLTSNWVIENIQKTEGMTAQDKTKVDFYTRQFLDAVSPTNFPMTNPEVLKKTIETKGENLVKGLENLLADLKRGDGNLKISITDYKAFEVGKNIATTEGSVVYENRMFQLIQYKPKGKQVYGRPLLISPPFINRFYILDLQQKNSFVRYAVEECNLNTFMISWKNPDETYANVGWEEYAEEGLLEAMTQVLNVTGAKDLNAIGYCIGGTLLSTVLAALVKKKDKRVNSATFFTTLMDFTDAGEIGVFIDEEQVKHLEIRMAKKGYLDGSEMGATFSMLRSNDMIWSFVINNYLLGQDPFPFDLLYWNDDSTRLPYKMHSYYLNNMYVQNNVVKKDKLTVLGEKVDISKIDMPIYMVGAVNDHITPWKSCFSPLTRMQSKEIRFALGKAGHVAGVACPPGNPKRAFWAGDVSGEKTADAWFEKQEMQQDSWWADWKQWIQKRSDKKVDAPTKLGGPKNKVIEAAPGRYVKERY